MSKAFSLSIPRLKRIPYVDPPPPSNMVTIRVNGDDSMVLLYPFYTTIAGRGGGGGGGGGVVTKGFLQLMVRVSFFKTLNPCHSGSEDGSGMGPGQYQYYGSHIRGI